MGFILREFLSFTCFQYRANTENEAWKIQEEVDLKYKTYGEKLQAYRAPALYKPDQSIHPETRHADEIEAELDKHLETNSNKVENLKISPFAPPNVNLKLDFKIDQIFSFISCAHYDLYRLKREI
jgi:hypothetical protein